MEFFEFIPLFATSRVGGRKVFPTLETAITSLFPLIFQKEIDLPLHFLLFIKLHVLRDEILRGVVPKRMTLLPHHLKRVEVSISHTCFPKHFQ